MDVDALVALQADEPRAGGGGERSGHLGLAHPGLPLEQQRLLERGGQEHRGGERPVGQVTLAAERSCDVFDRVSAQAAAACSSARRHSTRARWRL